MYSCWSDDPKDRPTFSRLVELFEEYRGHAYLNIAAKVPGQAPYENIEPKNAILVPSGVRRGSRSYHSDSGGSAARTQLSFTEIPPAHILPDFGHNAVNCSSLDSTQVHSEGADLAAGPCEDVSHDKFSGQQANLEGNVDVAPAQETAKRQGSVHVKRVQSLEPKPSMIFLPVENGADKAGQPLVYGD